ncbi:PilW family protein [Teredinibacter haidensis]|uniref:PilW family protein n=1 Tax=Teredinibacter haidensis TaxID=2731755 RepID=UPI000949034E|nr:PilW family protein [Teredinibacter haidensis]
MLQVIEQKMALKKQNGFSLIELLISLAIAGVILTGVVKIAFNAKRSSFDGEQLSFVQDNARFVLDQIKREVRMSGYTGCASVGSANVSNTIINNMSGFINLTESVQGFDGSVSNHPAIYAADVIANTDSFIVRFADASEEYIVRSHNTFSATFTLWSSEEAPTGSTMLVTDSSCREVGLFQVTGPGSDSTLLSHTADGTLNCTRVLRATSTNSVSCDMGCAVDSCNGNTEADFNSGSIIMPFRVYAYYIGESAIIDDMPALKRQVLTASGGSAVTETEEVATGVEDMQLLYGVDTDADGEANQYLTANLIVDWAAVVALRLTLVFRSDRDVYTSDQNVTIKLDGSDYQLSDDRLMRQVVTSTIKIRNN